MASTDLKQQEVVKPVVGRGGKFDFKKHVSEIWKLDREIKNVDKRNERRVSELERQMKSASKYFEKYEKKLDKADYYGVLGSYRRDITRELNKQPNQ